MLNPKCWNTAKLFVHCIQNRNVFLTLMLSSLFFTVSPKMEDNRAMGLHKQRLPPTLCHRRTIRTPIAIPTMATNRLLKCTKLCQNNKELHTRIHIIQVHQWTCINNNNPKLYICSNKNFIYFHLLPWAFFVNIFRDAHKAGLCAQCSR